MAHNLTETATYTANVSVPDGGDARVAASVEPAFQALANRAAYLKAHMDVKEQYARYRIEAPSPGVASGSKLTLAALHLAPLDSGHFTLASDEVTVPAAGIYLVSAVLRMACSNTSANLEVRANISAGTGSDTWESNQLKLAALRVADGPAVFASVAGLIKITDPATEKIKILAGISNIIVADDIVESHRTLTILRIT